jgi:hypothetical protein
VGSYLPLKYGHERYPLIAVNFWENRWPIGQANLGNLSWEAAERSSYRTFRPKFLYFLEKDEDGMIQTDLQPVKLVSQPIVSAVRLCSASDVGIE